jgi:hypothetical protein
MSDVYSSQRLDIRRPPVIVSVMEIVGGVILVLLAVVTAIRLTTNFREIRGIFENMRYDPNPVFLLQLLAYIVIVIIGLRLLIRGLKLMIHGLSEYVTPWRPSNIPGNFYDYSSVFNAFKQRILNCYVQTTGPLRSIFGPNTMFLSPAERHAVSSNAQAIGGHITGIVFSILLLAGSIIAGRYLYFQPVVAIFILAVILYSLLAGVDYAFSLMIVPKFQPNTVATEATEYFRGFGHPAQLLSRLNDASIPLRWMNFPNRVNTSWNENASTSVNDVGQFMGTAFIEQQPQPISDQLSKSAKIMLFVGWSLAVVGYIALLFFLVPAYNNEILPILFKMAGVLMFGAAAATNGDRMVNMARQMLESARFRSPAVFMEFVGHLSKAEVKLGSSMVDSIQSSNVAVRSDFTVRFWAAELITEAVRLDSPRDILALNQSAESAQWINFFKDAIAKLRDERVRPVGVEIQSQEAQEIVQANVAISGLRVGAEQQAVAQVAAGNPVQPPTLPSVGSEQALYCPACGALSVPGSRFCHACGTKLGG